MGKALKFQLLELELEDLHVAELVVGQNNLGLVRF
jgi:hypothetical protein